MKSHNTSRTLNQKDINILHHVATALKEEHTKMIYIGGAALRLYINHDRTDCLRPRLDEQATVQLAIPDSLQEMKESLAQKGFIETVNRETTRRYQYRDISVEIVQNKSLAWVPAKVWMTKALELSITRTIEDKTYRIVPFTYYLADRFSTFSGRDVVGVRTSHDLEVITFLLEQRGDWPDLILAEQDISLKLFLLENLLEFKNNFRQQKALKHALTPDTAEEKFQSILADIDGLLM